MRFATRIPDLMTATALPPHVDASVVHPAPADGAHDFDFLWGSWRIHNRRLRDPLTGSVDWYDFEGTAEERPFWGGQGNLEEYDAVLPDGERIRGLALRLYEPQAQRWTIHWSSSDRGTLDAPMTGTFRGGRGEFYSHEDFRGRKILVRFLWTHDTPDAARWEQAFSADAGRTWETNWIMEFTRVGDAPQPAVPAYRDVAACCPVVELRRYTLHPGKRDVLIELFEREFIEPQEAARMHVIAQFRDIDRPDVFTWLRGFPDMTSRAASLEVFYDGPVWSAHRDAANETMIDSDDVRLLRPVWPHAGLVHDADRPVHGAPMVAPGLVVATIYTLHESSAAGFSQLFEQKFTPLLIECGARPIAVYETEASVNSYPRLPVRQGERVFVWFARFHDVAAHDRAVAALAAGGRWMARIEPILEQSLAAPAEVWRLAPTARSRMPT